MKNSIGKKASAKRLLAAAAAVLLAGAVAVPASATGDLRPMASFEIRSGLNDMCLDVAGANPGDGAAVHTWTCNGGANQRWHWHGDQLRSELNGKCLDLAGFNTRVFAVVEVWSCNFADNQRWYWSEPFLTSALSGKYLTVLYSNQGLGVPAVMGDLDLFASAQRWVHRY